MIRRAYIGLGANQGDPAATLQAAVTSLGSLEQSSLVAVSPLYASTPVDAPGPDYINAVACLDTALEPYGLLLHLLELELVFGRKRRGPDAKRNAPRSVDLDLLLVGGLIMRSTPLTLPHPRMHERAFVLRPLLDVAPEIIVPGRGRGARLLQAVGEQRCVLVQPATALMTEMSAAPGSPIAPSAGTTTAASRAVPGPPSVPPKSPSA